MASPKIETLIFYSLSTGAPLTGLTPTFETYKNSSGTDLSQPSITEIGGGFYAFTPVFADVSKGICYVVDGGATANPRRYARYIRPEDWAADDATTTKQHLAGKAVIFTTGPDANREVIYDADGVTVLQKFDLQDESGNPTTTSIYKRIPV